MENSDGTIDKIDIEEKGGDEKSGSMAMQTKASEPAQVQTYEQSEIHPRLPQAPGQHPRSDSLYPYAAPPDEINVNIDNDEVKNDLNNNQESEHEEKNNDARNGDFHSKPYGDDKSPIKEASTTTDSKSTNHYQPERKPVSLARRKKDLRKLLRRLSAADKRTSITLGSSITSMASSFSSSIDPLPLNDFRSRIDAIESSIVEKLECVDDDSNSNESEFNVSSQTEEFPFTSNKEGRLEAMHGSGNDGDDRDGEDSEIGIEDNVEKIQNFLSSLKQSELENLRSMSITTKNLRQSNGDSGLRGSIFELSSSQGDDGDDVLAEILKRYEQEMDSSNTSSEENSVENVLRNSSIIPRRSLVDLKTSLKEEQKKMMKDMEELMRADSNVDKRYSFDSETRKVVSPSGIFRTDSEEQIKSPRKSKKPGGLFSLFSMLSKSNLHSDSDDNDDKVENQTSRSVNLEQMQDATPDSSSSSPNEIPHDSNHSNVPLNSWADTRFPPLDDIPDEKLIQDESLAEAFILHFIFRKFSTPPPPFNAVQNILEYERRRVSNNDKFAHSRRRKSIYEVSLVPDAVINVGDSAVDSFHQLDNDCHSTLVSPVARILEEKVLLKLPLYFRLAFCRILIRLLTGERDEEYDIALSLDPKGCQEGNASAGASSKYHRISTNQRRLMFVTNASSGNWRNEDLRHLDERNRARHSLSFNFLYSVVRFRCGERPGVRIDAVIDMIESLLEPLESESRRSRTLLLGPLCRLLGLLCAAGISPKQLRKVLLIIRDDTFRMNVNIHVLRALIVATEGSSLAKKLRGKASPRSFFCFGSSNGISQTFHPGVNTKVDRGWPFKSSFGMACWFRIEGFTSQSREQTLFKICSGDGTAFELSFKMLLGSPANTFNSSDAAHIIFTVRDSERSRKVSLPLSRSIEMTGFPIVPRVWFHISVRHVKKNLLSLTKDEVTILLDGKAMMTTQLRFPKSSTFDADGNQSSQQPAQPFDITFCSGIDAEAGSLYVFHDIVADETLYSLYKFTSGKSESVQKQRSGIIATIEKKMNSIPMTSFVQEDRAIMTMKKADVEEMAIPRDPISSGATHSVVQKRNSLNSLDLIGDDEYFNEIHNPTTGEFSRQAFVSNIYFVWDPSRVTDDHFVLEAHSGIHVSLDEQNCIPWQMRGAKDVISSVGGIQCLFPVFKSLIFPDIASMTSVEKSDSEVSCIGVAIPFAFSLLAAFLRENDNNGREYLRCGGTEMLEHFIFQSKKMYAGATQRLDFWIHINAFRRFHRFAEELVSILLDLKDACSYSASLESKISSRLIFNVDLWFGGLGNVPGTALHRVLFPTLSALAKADPDETSRSIRSGLMMNLIRELTILPIACDNTGCFGTQSQAKVLCTKERQHIIDIIMGILLIIFSHEVNASNLLPLIQFISFNLELEWKVMNSKDSRIAPIDESPETRHQRILASEKACSLLMLLLQTRPIIPGLYETLNQILGDTISWIICTMVNSYDEKTRSNGIRCFTAFYDAILDEQTEAQKPSSSITIFGAKRAVSKVSKTIKSVGAGLGVLQKGFDTSAKSLNISHKLLWHFLKIHRGGLSSHSYTSLLDLFVFDESSERNDGLTLSDYIISDGVLTFGYRLNFQLAETRHAPLHSSTLKVRNVYATSAILELLRFLPKGGQERLLFDLLTLLRVNESSIDDVTQARDWQNCLFHVVSDTVEELSNYNMTAWTKEHSGDGLQSIGEDTDAKENSNVFARFDLSFQLYATLLGHSLRDDNQSISALELASSLQRVCANGVLVFSILLSHTLNDLIANGTLKRSDVQMQATDESNAENRILKECASAFFNMEVTQAAKHWKKLRHITAIVVAVVTSNGYGMVNLFDYQNSLASIVDDNSGGIYGIRLGGPNSVGIHASDVVSETWSSRNDESEPMEQNVQAKQCYRKICTTLSNQVLELLDPFIFPDEVDKYQQQIVALIRSIEPRLGNSQGPLITSLIRLSLVLLRHLEPSSARFLKCCSMLRCFLHWCLDIVREIVPQAEAFHEETVVYDRLILCLVLQCHRSLSKCSSVLTELSMSPEKYFTLVERPRHSRRLYLVVEVLGGMVVDVYKGRNSILLESLSQEAYKALELSVATKDEWTQRVESLNGPYTQEARRRGITSFLEAAWIKGFHDNDFMQVHGSAVDIAIPEQLKSFGTHLGEGRNDRTALIMRNLAEESDRISEEYKRALDAPFSRYLEDQKEWTDTSAIRELEYDGNLSIDNLVDQYRNNMKDMIRTELLKTDLANLRLLSVERKIQSDVRNYRWKLAKYTDRMHRRILLIPNNNFTDHAGASYDLALGIEREKALKEREERLKSKKEEELANMYNAAKQGIVKPLVESEEVDYEENEDDSENASDTMSIGPQSDDDFIPGELITDWNPKDTDDIDLDSKYERGSYMWSKDYIWQQGERLVLYLESVQIVTIQTILIGEIVLTTHSLYFRPTDDPISVMTKKRVNSSSKRSDVLEESRWRLNRLAEVHGRRYMLRSQAIELYFADTHELFINFCGGVKVRDKFVDKLRQCKLPLISLPKTLNPKAVFKRRFNGLTQQWQQRKISNFEYLMQLNIIAGRTFNDISQYPVFPWIIADYTSDELDLNDPKSYRDLTKPVGALNPDRLVQLLQRYHDLDGLPEEERFLYGSHYSSPGVVLHYLIRQEPFTTMAIELQSGRFDCPDRLFYDISGCWKSCLQSTSDVKELVPELFTCPEMFLNTNGFPLGETQSKISISDVKLPPWANGSAHEFVRLHRLALESEYVSSNLHHWVDLIFGSKQRGLEAMKANNVFHFLSYEGSVNLDKISDELDRKATESQIQNFGQTPSQVLTNSHPCRYPANKCWKPIICETPPARRLMCYTPFKQFGGSRSKNSHGPATSIQLLADHVVVVYADLSVGSYRWAPTRHGKMPFYLKMDKIRPIASREMSISKFSMNAQTNMVPKKSNRHQTQSRIGVGNWSFAMTTGTGKGHDTSKNKTKDSTSSYIDATLLSCGYCDDALKAHSLDGLRLKCSEKGGHLGAINCLQLGEDGILLITGGEDATCRVWTVENANMGAALIDGYVKTADEQISDSILICCLVLWGHGYPISALAFDTDLDIVVSGASDGTICIHTVRCGEFIRSLQVNDFFPPANILTTQANDATSVRKLAIHKDGTFVAHLETGLLQMYTVNGVKLGCIDAGEKLNAMEMIPGGHSLVTGGESGHVIIRSLRNLEIRYVLDLSDYGPIQCIAFTPPPLHSKSVQQFMFVGTLDGSITVACAQREENIDNEDDEESSSAHYTQHQAFKKQDTKSWSWR